MSSDTSAPPARRRPVLRFLRGAARVLAAAGLGLDSYYHAHLASQYDLVEASISQGTLFRIEAALAGVAALLVLVWWHWLAEAFAWAVATGGLALLLIYRYDNIGAWGPFPNMYEPVWYTDKDITVIAQAVAIVATVFLLLTRHRRRRRRPRHSVA